MQCKPVPDALSGPLLATRLLLPAVGFFGLAHVAFLPPWEGFDEFAHWSYIQQIADTGAIPVHGRDRVSGDVDAYPGPMPYDGPGAGEGARTPTYRMYRTAGSPPLRLTAERHYRPGRALNWEAQHPPLFYLLLSPVCAGLTALIGGGWYVRNLLSFGDVVGGSDFIQLAQAGGALSGLRAHLSLAAVLRGLAVIPATFAWAGTWSLVRIPEPLLAVPLALVGCGVAGWLRRARTTSLASDPVPLSLCV